MVVVVAVDVGLVLCRPGGVKNRLDWRRCRRLCGGRRNRGEGGDSGS